MKVVLTHLQIGTFTSQLDLRVCVCAPSLALLNIPSELAHASCVRFPYSVRSGRRPSPSCLKFKLRHQGASYRLPAPACSHDVITAVPLWLPQPERVAV